jgi:hypothetical protein
MTENERNTLKPSSYRLADYFPESIEKPELRQKLIKDLSLSLDSDEKIEKFVENLGNDPQELKNLLKKPQ